MLTTVEPFGGCSRSDCSANETFPRINLREGGREGEREGGREGGREGVREGGREGGKEGGREED